MIISSRTAGEGKGGGWGRGEERILEIQMEEILVMNITEQLRERVKEERICDLGHTRHSGLVPPDVLGLVLCLFEPIPLQITHRIIGISAGLLYQLVLPPREFRTRVSVHSATLPTEKKIGHERLGGGRAGGGGENPPSPSFYFLHPFTFSPILHSLHPVHSPPRRFPRPIPPAPPLDTYVALLLHPSTPLPPLFLHAFLPRRNKQQGL